MVREMNQSFSVVSPSRIGSGPSLLAASFRKKENLEKDAMRSAVIIRSHYRFVSTLAAAHVLDDFHVTLWKKGNASANVKRTASGRSVIDVATISQASITMYGGNPHRQQLAKQFRWARTGFRITELRENVQRIVVSDIFARGDKNTVEADAEFFALYLNSCVVSRVTPQTEFLHQWADFATSCLDPTELRAEPLQSIIGALSLLKCHTSAIDGSSSDAAAAVQDMNKCLAATVSAVTRGNHIHSLPLSIASLALNSMAPNTHDAADSIGSRHAKDMALVLVERIEATQQRMSHASLMVLVEVVRLATVHDDIVQKLDFIWKWVPEYVSCSDASDLLSMLNAASRRCSVSTLPAVERGDAHVEIDDHRHEHISEVVDAIVAKLQYSIPLLAQQEVVQLWSLIVSGPTPVKDKCHKLREFVEDSLRGLPVEQWMPTSASSASAADTAAP